MSAKQKKTLIRIIIAFILFVFLGIIFHDFTGGDGEGSFFVRALNGMELSETGLSVAAWIEPLLYLAVYLIAGYDVLKKACKNIMHGQVFDENFLMIIAGIGAFAIGEYSEGVAVMLFYQVGELFQSYAVGKSRQSISDMMNIVPEYANVVGEDGSITQEDPEDVAVGSTILIKPGEKIPIDSKLIEGESFLDTSALTGESVPRHVKPGCDVISGCINGQGTLKCITTKAYEDSAVSVILELVENAGSRKSKAEQFITRFAKYYTPVVTISALLLAVIPSLITGNWMEWVRRACTFLVISCPCALVVSVPLGFFGGIGAASKIGVLVKGSNFLEGVSDAKIVAFDKTGTLTKGEFSVTKIISAAYPEHEVLKLAAAVEKYSDHPIALSIMKAYEEAESAMTGAAGTDTENIQKDPVSEGRGSDGQDISNIEELSGRGVSALYLGKKLLAGNAKLMEENGIALPMLNEYGTVCHIAYDGKYAGSIVISDSVKENAPENIAAMHLAGIKKTVMLTGDNEDTAMAVAEKCGLDDYFSQLLPTDKVSEIEELMDTLEGKEKLIFVGDGINDAPVLVRSDIGVAMGSLGSDAAIEAADIVIMDDDISKIPCLIGISRKTLRIVRQNIVFALSVKGLILILGAFGIAGMWLAVFADVGVAVLAILNSMRALKV